MRLGVLRLAARGMPWHEWPIFVYGTLKRGHPNHAVIASGRHEYLGLAVTQRAWPLVVATQYNVPFLLDQPGRGRRVCGELYRVDVALLARLDALEVHPELYTRDPIDVHLLPLTGSQLEPSGVDEKPTGCNAKQAGSDKDAGGYNKKPTGYDTQPDGSNKERTGSDMQPDGSNQEPTQPTGCHTPLKSDELFTKRCDFLLSSRLDDSVDRSSASKPICQLDNSCAQTPERLLAFNAQAGSDDRRAPLSSESDGTNADRFSEIPRSDVFKASVQSSADIFDFTSPSERDGPNQFPFSNSAPSAGREMSRFDDSDAVLPPPIKCESYILKDFKRAMLELPAIADYGREPAGAEWRPYVSRIDRDGDLCCYMVKEEEDVKKSVELDEDREACADQCTR